MRRFPLLFLILAFAAGSLRAQNYRLVLHRLDGGDSTNIPVLKIPPSFRDEMEVLDYVRHIPANLQEAGYLAASVDSLRIHQQQYDVFLSVGQRWHWVRLSLRNLPAGLMAATAISEAEFEGREIGPKSLSSLTRRILEWSDDHGYPFARVGLDSVRDDGAGGLSAMLAFDAGPLMKIDSVVVEGDVRLSKRFLLRYLDLKEGGVYVQSQLQKLDTRLQELPFLDAGSRARVQFKMGGAWLKLHLRERKSNLLNGIIGLQPNSGTDGKLLLTVDAQAAFQNLLGQGEQFSFSFQNLQPKSPRINAAATYPYLLGSPIGVDGTFELYFRNTEFRRTSIELGGRYSMNAFDYLRLYYRANSNRVISVDTAYILAFHQLPENIDLRSSGGGMELSFSRTDYRPNPRRGWSLNVNATLLQRNIIQNDAITGIKDGSGFDFSRLYDSVEAETGQIQARADMATYFALAKQLVLKLSYAGGWMSGDKLFQNELFQLGGFRSMRGFDEGSLYASQFHALTAELRVLLSRNSNFYLFSDNAWLQTNYSGLISEGFYHGLGLGTSLETKGGLFSIAVALGKSPGSSFQWRQAKVHVGYAAYF